MGKGLEMGHRKEGVRGRARHGGFVSRVLSQARCVLLHSPANNSRYMVEAGMRLTETIRSRRRNSVQSTTCLTDSPTSIVELVMISVDKLMM